MGSSRRPVHLVHEHLDRDGLPHRLGLNHSTNDTIPPMNHDHHPVELLLVALVLMAEGICWIINELTGGHNTPPKQQQQKPFIQPLFIELQDLTVKQLKAITGQRSSRLRKQQLIQLAYCC